MAAINPGYVPKAGSADFALGYQFHQGQLKKVSSLSFSAAKIVRKENGSAHLFRFTAYNEQQGPYITSPKAYLNYAIQIPLGEETEIYSGIALGTSGVFFSAPTFSSSAFLPDGSFGLGLNHRKVGIGASTLQMFNATSLQLGDTYRLGRFYTIYFSGEMELGYNCLVKAYVLERILPLSLNDVEGTISFLLNETVTLGSSIRYRAGTSFFAAFHLDPSENNLLLALTYNTAPLFTSLPGWQDSIEISLGFRIN